MFTNFIYCLYFIISLDSPEIPPSATAHELFRGFSFVNPLLISDDGNTNGNNVATNHAVEGRMVDSLLAKVCSPFTSLFFSFYDYDCVVSTNF